MPVHMCELAARVSAPTGGCALGNMSEDRSTFLCNSSFRTAKSPHTLPGRRSACTALTDLPTSAQLLDVRLLPTFLDVFAVHARYRSRVGNFSTTPFGMKTKIRSVVDEHP